MSSRRGSTFVLAVYAAALCVGTLVHGAWGLAGLYAFAAGLLLAWCIAPVRRCG